MQFHIDFKVSTSKFLTLSSCWDDFPSFYNQILAHHFGPRFFSEQAHFALQTRTMNNIRVFIESGFWKIFLPVIVSI